MDIEGIKEVIRGLDDNEPIYCMEEEGSYSLFTEQTLIDYAKSWTDESKEDEWLANELLEVNTVADAKHNIHTIDDEYWVAESPMTVSEIKKAIEGKDDSECVYALSKEDGSGYSIYSEQALINLAKVWATRSFVDGVDEKLQVINNIEDVEYYLEQKGEYSLLW